MDKKNDNKTIEKSLNRIINVNKFHIIILFNKFSIFNVSKFHIIVFKMSF